MIGWMASSLAGHDRNKIYIIIEETDEYVWLSDGALRPIEKPKRKNKKHIQVIKKNMDEGFVELLQNAQNAAAGKEVKQVRINEAMKRAIKLYKQSLA